MHNSRHEYLSIGRSEEEENVLTGTIIQQGTLRRFRKSNPRLFRVALISVTCFMFAALWRLLTTNENDWSPSLLSAPAPGEGEGEEGKALLAVPFRSIPHPMQPSALWGNVHKPFPTGAFWTNLVVENGNGAVQLHPYGIKADNNGVSVSYGAFRRSVSRKVLSDTFAVDLQLSATETFLSKSIVKYDNFSVIVGYELESATLTFPLVKGAPFVTAVYTDSTPVISSALMKITGFEQVKTKSSLLDVINTNTNAHTSSSSLDSAADGNGDDEKGKDGSHFTFTLGNFQKWYLYCSDPKVKLKLEDNTIKASEPIQGYIRVAFMPSLNNQDDSLQLLQAYAPTYPTGAKLIMSYPLPDTADLNIHYETAGGAGAGAGGGSDSASSLSSASLLMFALHHHMPILQSPDMESVENVNARSVLQHVWSLKGMLTPVVGNSWTLRHKWVDVGWNYAVSTTLTTAQMNTIAQALLEDVKSIPPTAPDPYGFGKQINRMARLAVLADDMGIAPARQSAVESLKNALKPWVAATNSDSFLYDNSYGGVVTTEGIADKSADYGSGWYNDHHFHYGYFLHAAAVLARFDRTFFDLHEEVFDALRKDICHMDSTSDPNYPFARHKDFFDGHSWASGLFQQANGKSQESSSESIHAYYGCYLYAVALQNEELQKFSKTLLTMEIHSARSYWQMAPSSNYGHQQAVDKKRKNGEDEEDLISNGSSSEYENEWMGVYDDVFAASRMVGNLGALDATTSTWFGDALEYVHGINIMPLSPITATIFSADYVQGQYPVLATAVPPPIPEKYELCSANAQCVALKLTEGKCCPNMEGMNLACCESAPGGIQRMQSEWESYIYIFLAVIDRDAAWEKLVNMTGYGMGNSKANTLYWAMSRAPSSIDMSSSTSSSRSSNGDKHISSPLNASVYFSFPGPTSCAANSACDALGMQGECCPTAAAGEQQGTFLACCPKSGI